MPHYKCTNCHHEFDMIPKNPLTQLCDWCGSPAFILEDKIPLEKLADHVEKHGWEFLKGDEK